MKYQQTLMIGLRNLFIPCSASLYKYTAPITMAGFIFIFADCVAAFIQIRMHLGALWFSLRLRLLSQKNIRLRKVSTSP